MTSVASMVREQAECGKPVVICILAFSLVFHAVTLANAAVSEKTLHIFRPIPDAEYVVLFVERFMMSRYGQTGTHG